MECVKRFLSSEHRGGRILIYLGEGAEGSGAWCFADGEVHFSEILDIWNLADASSSNTLLVYSDSCYSGHLCKQAAEMKANVFVQASCAEDETALGNAFAATWLKVQHEPQSRHSFLTRFETQNQQHVVHYAPQQVDVVSSGSGDPAFNDLDVLVSSQNLPTVTFGDLVLQLLGKSVSASAEGACAVDSSMRMNNRPDELYESLPADLQLVVANLAVRFGWNNPELIKMMESIVQMCEKEARRGSDGMADISDVLELLREFVDDESLSSSQALEKFKEEFD